jgi:threonine dehydratase
LIAGVATAYLEALLAVPDADVVIVPIGGGSGACGAAIVARALHPTTRVIGVQAEGAPAVYRSFYSGQLEATDAAATCAEGLATRMAFELPLRILRKHLDEIILIGDMEMRRAMRLLLETTHLVAEEAGAAATAAALKLHVALAGLRVVLPITGGNATAAQLLEALQYSSQ